MSQRRSDPFSRGKALGLAPSMPLPEFPQSLATTVAGLRLPSPIGLAAAFDKNAECRDAMLGLGFGFVEVGTLPPRPQQGNPRPRLFRLKEDRAVINRMGFNNDGQAAALERLRKRDRRGIVGVNIGANKDSPDFAADYVAGIETIWNVASYFTANISSPNTPGLRNLQAADAFPEFPARVPGQPLELAGGALLLASDEADFITGYALVVDGGLTLRT